MNRFAAVFPWLIVLLALAYLGYHARAPREGEGMRVHEFAKLPVVDRGRVKPMDTVARVNLMATSERQQIKGRSGATRSASAWLLDVFSGHPRARDDRVFRVVDDRVIEALGLEPREDFRYSVRDLGPVLGTLQRQAERAHAKEAGERDVFDRSVLKLANDYARVARLARHQAPLMVPPDGGRAWRSLAEARKAPGEDPAAAQLARIFEAYAAGEVRAFNSRLADYQAWLWERFGEHKRKTVFETFFNDLAPFYRTAILYVGVFLLACLAWLGWARPLLRGGMALAAFAFLVHTGALGARMWLEGRPPVTNLYASAIFVGWGCVGLGLLLEWLFRDGMGLAVASVTGFLSLLVAHHLGQGSDTLEMMQAVLDTNFWLATHVTTITLGYTAVFVAGFLAILYVLRGVFTRTLDAEAARQLARMIYGVLCFALLLSFTGTVLGGIWADQSWGRFWGWDPKENGALIIVLWVALILHARWGGMIRQRGMAVLSIFGNIAVTWSWFGVNELGAGLHSYGFTEGTTFWLLVFAASQLLLIGLGLLPMRWWRSGRPEAGRPARQGVAAAPPLQ